jgi:biotin transport system substrate-specific component
MSLSNSFPAMKRIIGEVIAYVVLLYICSQIRIPVPLSPVPITLQTFLVILLPLFFSRTGAMLGISSFLLLAGIGAPVLSGGAGGWDAISGPSGGYLGGFFVVTFITLWLREHLKTQRILKVFSLFVVLQLIIMTLGIGWIVFGLNKDFTFASMINPYLPGLVLKSILGAFGFWLVEKVLNKLGTHFG